MLPPAAASAAVRAKAVAPARALRGVGVRALVLGHALLLQIVAEHHVLERVPDFVRDGAPHRLTRAGIHPKGAYDVIVSAARSQPFALIDKVDFHLVAVQHRLSLARVGKLQRVDVHLVEKLCLHQQVIDINSHIGNLTR